MQTFFGGGHHRKTKIISLSNCCLDSDEYTVYFSDTVLSFVLVV